MQIERKIFDFAMKATSSNGSTFEGYANAFNNIDLAGEIVAPGAFDEALDDFLKVGFIGGLNHNWDEPIGKPTSAKEDATGLFIRAKISDTEHGRDCMVLLKDDVIKKMSIGYRVKSAQYLETAEEVAAYWQGQGYTPTAQDVARSQYGARLLLKINPLYECSPVTVPCNALADITGVKGMNASEIVTERQFEKFLREVGFPWDAAKTITASGFKALRQRDVEEQSTNETPPAQETPSPSTPEPQTPPVVAVAKADQAEVRALYAQFLNQQAAAYAPRR